MVWLVSWVGKDHDTQKRVRGYRILGNFGNLYKGPPPDSILVFIFSLQGLALFSVLILFILLIMKLDTISDIPDYEAAALEE